MENKNKMDAFFTEVGNEMISRVQNGVDAGKKYIGPVVSGIRARREESEKKLQLVRELARQCLARIDALYALKDDSPCGKWLRECAQWKAELSALRAAGEAAQRVLGIYYQSGRIRDTLERLDAFSRGEHIPSTPELVRLKGYNNYCSVLMQDVAALRQVTIPEVARVQAGREAVEALLREECSRMALWKDIPQVRSLCQSVLEDPSFRLTQEQYDQIKQTMEALKAWKEGAQPTQEMVLRRDSMRQQNKKLRDNIQEARDICNRLLPVLTEEWFQKLAPEIEDNPINQKDTDEVLQLYREALSGLIK